MLNIRLDEITEATLTALQVDEIPEGLQLDFKNDLDLSMERGRRDAARDVCALANTVGGRLVYGIDERTLPDGRIVAGPISPLTDGSVEERLSAILSTTISPLPRLRFRSVQVTGGFVLVVEVENSELDLYMVTGYSDNRYYRRTAKGNVPMTEPEVREAYVRIAALRTSLEADLAARVAPELARRSKCDESIILIPWHGSPDMLDPRKLSSLGSLIWEKVTPRNDLSEAAHRLRVQADGLRSVREGVSDESSTFYLAVLRDGLFHLSLNVALHKLPGTEDYALLSPHLLIRVLWAVRAAAFTFGLVGYNGRVRMVYRLMSPGTLRIDPDWFNWGYAGMDAPAQTLGPVNLDTSLREMDARPGRLVKEILDRVFQMFGQPTCPHLDADGRMTEYMKKVITNTPIEKALG